MFFELSLHFQDLFHVIRLFFDDLVFAFDLEKADVVFVGEDLFVDIFGEF